MAIFYSYFDIIRGYQRNSQATADGLSAHDQHAAVAGAHGSPRSATAVHVCNSLPGTIPGLFHGDLGLNMLDLEPPFVKSGVSLKTRAMFFEQLFSYEYHCLWFITIEPQFMVHHFPHPHCLTRGHLAKLSMVEVFHRQPEH